MGPISNRLYLCAGLEESGASLVSWCFWQRAEIRPMVAPAGDLLPEFPPSEDGRATWLLTTLSSFRLSEMAAHYRDLGWEVQPLLVFRDLREIWAALVQKPAIHNGITSEDPPLRLRFRRFVDDWRLFAPRGWPMLRIEDLMGNSRQVLRETCGQLGLSWHEVMAFWPRPLRLLANAPLPDAAFCQLRGRNLAETLMNHVGRTLPDAVAAADLEWLESEFHDFNVENGYPARLKRLQVWTDLVPRGTPSGKDSRRYAPASLERLMQWLSRRAA